MVPQASQCMCAGQRTTDQLVLSPSNTKVEGSGPRSIRFAGEHLYLLSHLASPGSYSLALELRVMSPGFAVLSQPVLTS